MKSLNHRRCKDIMLNDGYNSMTSKGMRDTVFLKAYGKL